MNPWETRIGILGHPCVQRVITSADEILTALLGDETFSSYLGRYRFDDGEEGPAISLVSTSQRIDGLISIDGLEVLIRKYPEGTSRPDLTGGSIEETTWKLYLIQYRNDREAIESAADRITELMPGATYSNIGAGQVSAIAGVEQFVVSVPGTVVIDPSLTADGGGDFDTGAIDPAA